MMRRSVSLILAIVLVLSVVGFSPVEVFAAPAAKPLPELTGNIAKDLAAVAKSQVGYTPSNGTCYGEWWNDQNNSGLDYTELDWCSMFACWVSYQAGLKKGYGYSEECASVTMLYHWYKDNMIFNSSFSKEPQVGDFIFFQSDKGVVKHVAVVTAYNPDTKVVTFVGGNQGKAPGAVTKNWCYWKKGVPRPDVNQYVLGYGRSKYATVKDICEHSLGSWTISVAPTCTRGGEEIRYCGKCDYYELRDVAAGHSMGSWSTRTAATCTTDGEQIRYCGRCDHYEIRTVTGGHSYSSAVTAPTCTLDGYTAYYCHVCGNYYMGNLVPALGHSGQWECLEEPSVMKNGLMGRECTVCGVYEEQLLDMAPLPFKDVKKGSWYETGIRYAFDGGWMQGMSQDEFWPSYASNRAMLVTILWRMEGSPKPEGETPFEDLTQNWYKDAVGWAYENGVVLGKTDTQFAPTESLTRQQLAAMLYRYCQLKEYATNHWANMRDFPDWEETSDYAKEPIGWALGVGLIQGVKQLNDEIHLEPTGYATRAQLAIVIMRFCEKYMD